MISRREDIYQTNDIINCVFPSRVGRRLILVCQLIATGICVACVFTTWLFTKVVVPEILCGGPGGARRRDKRNTNTDVNGSRQSIDEQRAGRKRARKVLWAVGGPMTATDV
jgi:hypothetical protein